METESIKLNGAAMNQKAADEVKSMLQDLEAHLTKKHDDKFSIVDTTAWRSASVASRMTS